MDAPELGFFQRHGRKLWWLHSAYALGLGAFVVTFAQRGYRHARWLTLSLLLAWALIVVLFRVQKLDGAKAKVGFYAATYVLKNLFQGMLFFLLPFYWNSATPGAGNRWFVVFLGACTLLATLDLVFDRVLMRWRVLASSYYVVALFAVLNLALPTIWPMAAVWSLVLAGGVAVVGFWTLQFGLRPLRQPLAALALGLLVVAGAASAYAARRVVPPVPLRLATGAVGPASQWDGTRLKLQVTSLDRSLMREMVAVTAVDGAAEGFVHVWRHDGTEVHREALELLDLGDGRFKSDLAAAALPVDPSGVWSVDVETAHGQLVGRLLFQVTR